MRQLTTPERGNSSIQNGPPHALEPQIDQPLLYFLACRDLRSDDPTARRPAIIALLELARYGTTTIRARAIRFLEEEFGPYVATHGFIGCAAPLSASCVTDDDGPCCHNCPYQWSDEEP